MRKGVFNLFSSAAFRLALGLVLSGLALYLSFRHVEFNDVRRAISGAEAPLAGLALAGVLLSLLGKVIRWRILLGPKRPTLGFPLLLASLSLGQFLNALSPVRLGDLSRAQVIGVLGPGRTFILGTLVLEKTLDMLAFALIFILLLVGTPLPEWMDQSGYVLTGLALMMLAALLFAVYQRLRLMRALNRATGRFPEDVRQWAASRISAGISSLDVLRNRPDALKLATLTICIWGMAVLVNYLTLLSMQIDLPFQAALLVLVILQAGVSLPSAPASLGIFEYGCVLALSVYEIDNSIALSYGILLHVIVYLPILVLGLLSFWSLGLGKGRKLWKVV